MFFLESLDSFFITFFNSLIFSCSGNGFELYKLSPNFTSLRETGLVERLAETKSALGLSYQEANEVTCYSF